MRPNIKYRIIETIFEQPHTNQFQAEYFVGDETLAATRSIEGFENNTGWIKIGTAKGTFEEAQGLIASDGTMRVLPLAAPAIIKEIIIHEVN